MIKNFVVVSRKSEVHKTLYLLFNFFFVFYLENGGGGGEDVTAAARLATGSGSVSREYLGKAMPWGTTNPL